LQLTIKSNWTQFVKNSVRMVVVSTVFIVFMVYETVVIEWIGLTPKRQNSQALVSYIYLFTIYVYPQALVSYMYLFTIYVYPQALVSYIYICLLSTSVHKDLLWIDVDSKQIYKLYMKQVY
jgi:hypothetical protein